MKEEKSNIGAKGFDVVLLFKILVLQSLYNFSDESMQFHVIPPVKFQMNDHLAIPGTNLA
ncbi:MAG: hypothetical protein PHZ02_06715 [Desulfocapsaceae bacterium]|nr:hypothetical protein [Desulfocapsaceae bacterium]